MQAKLPDVNAAIVKHRSDTIAAYISHNYHLCIISLNAIIALLPDETEDTKSYKVEINTEKYNELTQEKHTITCEKCNTEHQRSQIKTIEALVSQEDCLMSSKRYGLEYETIWYCPKCNHKRNLIGSNFKTFKYQEPYYLKVIPRPPRHRGLINKIEYPQEFSKWFDIALSEIESQIGLYRADYAAQQSEELEILEDA